MKNFILGLLLPVTIISILSSFGFYKVAEQERFKRELAEWDD